MMRKIFTLALFIAFAVFSAQAQNDRVEALRIAYLTETLELTVEESQQFWPLFNEYEAKRKEIRRNTDRRKNTEEMTEAEAQQFITDNLDAEQKTLNLKREYFVKFQTVISAKRLARLPRAEKDFKRELLKRMKQRRENAGDRPRRGGF